MSIETSRMPEWVKVWGPVALVLGAMWTMTTRLEDRLAEEFRANRDAIRANRDAIVENGKAIARLEGLVRGLHGLGLEGDG